MNKIFTLPAKNFISANLIWAIALFSFLTIEKSNAQILKYIDASSGSLYLVAANVTGTPLTRVNGAAAPGSPCSVGFNSNNFSSATTFSTSLAAIEVSVTPAPGNTLNITGFSADTRRSGTGPAYLRFAYSLNGGSTWINQGSNKSNPSASCGATSTFTWSTSFTVSSPANLKFRIYGFNASSTGGNEQILNLIINGTVTSACSPPALSTSATNVSCNGGNNGTVNLAVSGGTSPYTYLWSNGATIQNIANLVANTYSVKVTDSKNCSATTSATVTQPAILSAVISSQTNAGCNGSGGQATVAASGGTSPYFYAWNTTPAQSTLTATGLVAGTYTVNVTDAHNCSASTSVTIATASPSSLSASSITSSSATLNWSAVSAALSYNIQYRKTTTTSWASATSTTNSLPVSGSTTSTTYEFQVQAVCSAGASAFSPSATFTTSGASLYCDASLWNHVYNSYRLIVYNSCTSVTGIVDNLIYEADGDIHIRLNLDTPYKSMLNASNINNQYGDLVCEPICVSTVTQTSARSACRKFHNTVYIPNVGEHVQVVGSYVKDNEHGWNEIHPITSITIISPRLANPEPTITDDNLLSVSPNPSSTYLDFKLNKLPSAPVFITISDAIGRSAGQYQLFESTDLQITTKYLPNGIYYYSAMQNNKLAGSGKFIVQH